MQIHISSLPLATKNRPKERRMKKRATKKKVEKNDVGKFLMTLQGCIFHDSMCVIHFYAWPPTKIFFIFLSMHITSTLLTQNINNEI
jgi:hypothetical protein